MQLPRLRLKLGSTRQNPLVVLILLFSGQCPDPGPRYLCGVCNLNISWRATFYLCSSYRKWVHASCSDIKRSADYQLGVWIAQAAERDAPAQSSNSSVTTNPRSNFKTIGRFMQLNTNDKLNSNQQFLQLLQDQKNTYSLHSRS